MNYIEQQLVDIATAALVRGGQEQPAARVIALETVADHLTQQSKRIRENAQYAESKTYYRELNQANELLARANYIMAQASKLREEAE